ncbi:response regulator [Candidatus Pacebacteria bacterium]|nr:response regulator [Candidatus Paceibacterota bacterium]
MSKSKKHILIAEDEAPLAKALSLKLQNSGFDTTATSNGEGILELIEKEKIDLLILDLMMPKVDGFKVLKELQDNKKNIPVMVTSNLGQEEDVEKAKKLGAKEYFVKSNIPLKDIVVSVEKILNKSKQIKVK